MGLPQDPPAKEDAPTRSRTPVSSPPHFRGVGACDLDGLPGGSSSCRVFPYPSIGDFSRKTALDVPDESNGFLRDSHAFDGPAGLRVLQFDSRDANSRSSHKLEPAVHTPTMRVVGFQSGSVGGFDTTEIDTIHSSVAIDNCHSPFDQHELQARKRLLSPLKNVLPRQFHGDTLNIACGDARFQHSDESRKLYSTGFQDSKKANTGSLNYFESHALPISRCSNWSPEWDVNRINSNLFTDGPLLGSKDPLSYYDHLAASAKLAHTPLSLSPLSPKCMHKIEITGAQRHIMRDLENDFLDLKEKGGSDGIRIPNVLEETNILHDEFDVMAHKRSSCRRYRNWDPESALTSPRVGYVRGLSLS